MGLVVGDGVGLVAGGCVGLLVGLEVSEVVGLIVGDCVGLPAPCYSMQVRRLKMSHRRVRQRSTVARREAEPRAISESKAGRMIAWA